MAQLTALQVMNKVLDNNGLPQVTVLTSLTGINNVALNMIQTVLAQVASGDSWRPLETTGTITLATSTATYALPSDFNKLDKRSFKYLEQHRPTFIDSNEMDLITLDQDATGEVTHIFIAGTNFNVYPVPTATENGDTITYRYWKVGTRIDTASPSAATWFPEPYDETVLVNMATARLMSYRQMGEAIVYTQIVYGVRGSLEGSLDQMKKVHSSPTNFRVPVSFGAGRVSEVIENPYPL